MTSFHPAPKPKRIKDRKAIDDALRRDGCCLYGMYNRIECSGALHPHHIKSRGSGGGDVMENLITLCAKHHDKVHRGLVISDELEFILNIYYGYREEECPQ